MRKRLLSRVALLAATCLLLFIIAEVAARILLPAAAFGDDPTLAGKYRPHRRLRYRSEIDGFDVRVRYNSLGMRDVEHAFEKPPGVFRILVLGDSFMEGKQVELEETFCRRLERILSAMREVEVVNTGHAGFGSAEQCLVLRQLGPLMQPDLVVQAFFMNDVSDDAAVASEIVWSGTGAPLRMIAQGPRSRFAQWLAARLNALPFRQRTRWVQAEEIGDPGHDPFAVLRPGRAMRDDAAWDRTLRCLSETARLARGMNAGYLLVVIPLAQQVDPTLGGRVAEVWRLEPGGHFDFPQERLAAFGREEGIDVLDLLPVFRAEAEPLHYFPNDGHWTPAGHALAARTVADYLGGTHGTVPHEASPHP